MCRLSNFNHEQIKDNNYVIQAKLFQLISRVIISQVADTHNLTNVDNNKADKILEINYQDLINK